MKQSTSSHGPRSASRASAIGSCCTPPHGDTEGARREGDRLRSARMGALLIYGDTERSATLRHEVPLAIGDPFLFVQNDGAPLIVTNPLERERIGGAPPGAEVVMMNGLGFLDLVRGGMPGDGGGVEGVSRAGSRGGGRAGSVPPELPVAVADRLRADGV